MAKRYLVTSANPEFAGKAYGVQFDKGKAVVEEATLPELARPLEEIVWGFQNDLVGYTVKELGGEENAPAAPESETETSLPRSPGVPGDETLGPPERKGRGRVPALLEG